jgi:arylformamidase
MGSHRNVSRRKVLASSAMLAAAAGAAVPPAVAQQPPAQPREKGPRVWLDMDQKELDDAYDQAVYAPNINIILKRCARVSELVRERLGAPRRVAYGPSAVEGLDLFIAKAPGGQPGAGARPAQNAPVNVFVHGGAWRGGLAKNYHYPAELFVNAGAHLVVLDFINVVEAGGDLVPMADQVRRAVAWVYRNAQSFGGDPERLYVSGHSSGAHLVGVLATTDWQKDFSLPPTLIKGAVAASGLYDLKPVRLSKRSSYVKFTDEMEHALSAQGHLDKLAAPLALVYGTEETPEFQRQTRDFAAAVKAASKPMSLTVMEGYNHFEVMESLANPYGAFGRAVLEQMRLAPA